MTGSRALHGRFDAIQSTVRRPHFSGLESLRAIAASMVVVHHVVFVAGERAGRLERPAAVMDGGVAVFFVLSGFLIFRPFAAALVAGSARQPALSFLWRRVLRIVPAYWLALSVLWAAGNFHLGSDWWRYYLLVQPFSRYTAIGGIVPAWSLSTEMSFYLLVPVLAGLIGVALARLRFASTEGGRALAVAGAVALTGLIGPLSRATARSWAGDEVGLAFQWLPTNLDLFAAGMVLAVISVWLAGGADRGRRLHTMSGPAWAWWAAAAAVFLVYAYRVGGVALDVGYTGWYWQRRQFVFVAFSVLLLVPAVFGDQERGRLRRVWSWRPVVWVGSVSYGLYLWHLGLLERLVDSPPGQTPGWNGILPYRFGSADPVVVAVVTFAAGLAAAALSWYLLERPLQRFKGMLDSVARRGRERA